MKKLTITLLFFAASNLFAQSISIQINTGEYWKKRSPQCAIWLEDENNNYIETIYVTKSASKGTWLFAPKIGRPESLPIWYKKANGNPKLNNSDSFDAVTCATPKKTFYTEKKLSLEDGKKYYINIEVNQSFDYNEKWTKSNSSPNGQPSLLYQAEFICNEKQEIHYFNCIGIGSIDENNTLFSSADLDSITTAKLIIDSIKAKIY